MDMRFRQKFLLWIEEYLFYPKPFQQLLSALLLPLTLIYCLIKFIQKSGKTTYDFGIKVVSIGNLLLGGTGKTPFTIALSKIFPNNAIVLRGYKRESKGLKIVANKGNILVSSDISGDEAYEYALSCPNSIVIVSEDRAKGVLKAKELGANVVFLDDGYSKKEILKLDILLRPYKEPTNLFCLPSGGYKEPKIEYFNADIVAKENIDFHRKVSFSFYDYQTKSIEKIEKLPQNLLFISAISKPKRVLEFLPQNIKYQFFEDHYKFKQEDIDRLQDLYKDINFIVTKKDFVKLQNFGIDLYIINLDITINQDIIDKVSEYIHVKESIVNSQ